MFNVFYSAVSEIARVRVPNTKKVNDCVFRDELSKNAKPTSSKLKGEVDVPLLQRQEYDDHKNTSHKKEGQRVKILMTKEEAARLLSKCKDGGVLDFKDVESLLERIPVNRVSLGNNMLNSIPEED